MFHSNLYMLSFRLPILHKYFLYDPTKWIFLYDVKYIRFTQITLNVIYALKTLPDKYLDLMSRYIHCKKLWIQLDFQWKHIPAYSVNVIHIKDVKFVYSIQFCWIYQHDDDIPGSLLISKSNSKQSSWQELSALKS